MCSQGKDRHYIQCTTPSLKELNIRTPVITKVAFILDGFSTVQFDLLYVEDPNFAEFQQPTITIKGSKSILEIKVSVVPQSNPIQLSLQIYTFHTTDSNSSLREYCSALTR